MQHNFSLHLCEKNLFMQGRKGYAKCAMKGKKDGSNKIITGVI